VAEALPEGYERPIHQPKASQSILSLREQVETFEKQILLQGFRDVGGNVSELSRRLKIDRANLHRKLKIYGIK
jgi:DNA-binding NtrC family response regulator